MMKDSLIYLEHINKYLNRIETSMKDLSKEEFLSSPNLQDATLRKWEIVGEATKKLSKGFRDKHSEIDWRILAKQRDKLAHQYFDIELEIIWDTNVNDLPPLKMQVETILRKYNNLYKTKKLI